MRIALVLKALPPHINDKGRRYRGQDFDCRFNDKDVSHDETNACLLSAYAGF